MPVRALLRVATVDSIAPPYNQIQLKVFYPALDATTPDHFKTGVLPVDEKQSPFPVIIFFPGVNCSPHTYEWLAHALVAEGYVMAIVSWVGQNLPGRTSITPGINIEALSPDIYGTLPTSSSLATVLTMLRELQDEMPLAGHLDLNRIILGGHSAGGTIALQNAKDDFCAGVCASFAICANPLATAVLGGWARGVIQAIPSDHPILLIGASEDGIGDHHNQIFGRKDERGADTIMRQLQEHTRNEDDSYCFILEGANHHTVCYPLDTSIGRTFLDSHSRNDVENRQAMIRILVAFLGNLKRRPNDEFVDTLEKMGADATINTWLRK